MNKDKVFIIPEEIEFDKINTNQVQKEIEDEYYAEKVERDDSQFIKTNIKILNFEKFENKSELELSTYLAELEKELYHLLIFDDEPKLLLKTKNKTIINKNDPGAYYDPTEIDKENSIEDLKIKIMEIRRTLQLPEKIAFQINYKNSTFPVNSNDVIPNYENNNEETIKQNTKYKKINGNYKNIQDLYKARTDLLKRMNENNGK